MIFTQFETQKVSNWHWGQTKSSVRLIFQFVGLLGSSLNNMALHARRVKSKISISPQYVHWEVLRSLFCCRHVINNISDVSTWGGFREPYYSLLFLAWKNPSLSGSTLDYSLKGRPLYEFSKFWRFFKDSAWTSQFHGSRPAEVVAHHYSEDNHEKVRFLSYMSFGVQTAICISKNYFVTWVDHGSTHGRPL